MQSIRRALLAVAAVIGSTAPALAQTAAAPASTGPSLIWVWVWILVAGVIIMIVGTSAGVNGNRR